MKRNGAVPWVKTTPESEFGGEGGIRTLGTLLTYTHFPGVLLQPLGHLSGGKRGYRRSAWLAISWHPAPHPEPVIRGRQTGTEGNELCNVA